MFNIMTACKCIDQYCKTEMNSIGRTSQGSQQRTPNLAVILPAIHKAEFVPVFAALFNLVWFLTFWTYVTVHCSDPGTITEKWRAFVRDSPGLDVVGDIFSPSKSAGFQVCPSLVFGHGYCGNSSVDPITYLLDSSNLDSSNWCMITFVGPLINRVFVNDSWFMAHGSWLLAQGSWLGARPGAGCGLLGGGAPWAWDQVAPPVESFEHREP